MATENDIRVNMAVVREGLLAFAKIDKTPKEGVTMMKAGINLLEIALIDLHRIADAVEHTATRAIK